MDLQPSLCLFLEQFNELFPNASCIKLYMGEYFHLLDLKMNGFRSESESLIRILILIIDNISINGSVILSLIFRPARKVLGLLGKFLTFTGSYDHSRVVVGGVPGLLVATRLVMRLATSSWTLNNAC